MPKETRPEFYSKEELFQMWKDYWRKLSEKDQINMIIDFKGATTSVVKGEAIALRNEFEARYNAEYYQVMGTMPPSTSGGGANARMHHDGSFYRTPRKQ